MLQVHLQVSRQPTEKVEVYFLFRGPGGLGIQRVHGGFSLAEWYLGLQGQDLGRGVDGYFTTLAGRILNPEREVSGLGLDGLQEVVGSGVERFVVARRWRSLILESGSGAAHCWNTRLSCYRCGTHRNWQSGGAGHGGLVSGQRRENGFRREWLVRGLVVVCGIAHSL